MAPPLVKGKAAARQRLAGIVFLVVLALLVELSIALYQKRFTSTFDVTLRTDRAGNQLSVHADVKARGVIVGEVRKVRTQGEGATLELALIPEKAKHLPRDVRAQLIPKTLFGEKEVALVLPSGGGAERLRENQQIPQDTSAAFLETEQALNDALPLLQSLNPEKLSLTLNALSQAVRGRGDRLGAQLASNAAYFRKLNPALPTLAQDMAGLADLASTTADVTPNLLATLDNLSASSRSLVQERAALDAFLTSTTDFAASARQVVGQNEKRFVDLARDSRPTVELFAKYSGNFPCLLNRIAFSEIEGERVFGGAQPGLHITIEATQDQGGYHQGDEPLYGEKRYPGCYGLGPKAIIPFPGYINPKDGYDDNGPPDDPGTGPPNCCPEPKMAWIPGLLDVPPGTAVRSMPARTTPFEALLLAPLAGSGLI